MSWNWGIFMLRPINLTKMSLPSSGQTTWLYPSKIWSLSLQKGQELTIALLIRLVEFHMPMSTVVLVEPSGLKHLMRQLPVMGGAESWKFLGRVTIKSETVSIFLMLIWLEEGIEIERVHVKVSTVLTILLAVFVTVPLMSQLTRLTERPAEKTELQQPFTYSHTAQEDMPVLMGDDHQKVLVLGFKIPIEKVFPSGLSISRVHQSRTLFYVTSNLQISL